MILVSASVTEGSFPVGMHQLLPKPLFPPLFFFSSYLGSNLVLHLNYTVLFQFFGDTNAFVRAGGDICISLLEISAVAETNLIVPSPLA